MLKSPLQRLPAAARWPALAVLLALTLWLWTQTGGDRRLYSRKVSPRGLLSLERARDLTKAEEILAFWDRWVGRQNVIKSLNIIIIPVYLLCYSTMLALACVIAADRFDSIGRLSETHYRPDHRFIKFTSILVRLGILLSWVQWLVVIVGLIEKKLLIDMLDPSSSITPGQVRIIGTLTDIEILLRLIGIIYAVMGAGVYFSLFFLWPGLLDRSRR